MTENEIGGGRGCGGEDPRALGPGLLESVYELLLAHELAKRGLKSNAKCVPIVYEGLRFDEAFRADLVVNGWFSSKSNPSNTSAMPT